MMHALLMVIPASFLGIWFKRTQLSLLTAKLIAVYPLMGWIDAILSSVLILASLAALDQWWLTLLSKEEGKRRKLNRLLYFSHLLFICVYFSVPLKFICAALVLLRLTILLALLFQSSVDTKKIIKSHSLALLFVLITQITFNSFLTPARWIDPIVSLDLYESAIDPINGGAHRVNYVNSKLFDFSGMEHSNWGLGILFSQSSPLLGMISFLFDLPSMDVQCMLRTLMIIAFSSCVIGSFGFFLFCLHALKLSYVTSLLGSALFVIGNFFIAENITQYFPLFFVPYLFLPYALWLSELGIRKKNLSLLWASGGSFAFSFYVYQSHPEVLIEACTFWLCYLLFLVWQAEFNFRTKMTSLCVPFLAMGVLISALYAPFLQAIFQRDLNLSGHQDYVLCTWGLKFSWRIILPLLQQLIPLILLGFLSQQKFLTSQLLKDRRFLFFSIIFLMLSTTLPGRDSPFVIAWERLQIFKAINLYAPARLWTYLYLSGLIMGLISLDRFREKDSTFPILLKILTLIFSAILFWRFRNYVRFHHSELYLVPAFLLVLMIAIKHEGNRGQSWRKTVLCCLMCFHILAYSGILGWPNIPEEKNPGRCRSYIGMESLLTKYEALLPDALANNRVMRRVFGTYETDIKLKDGPVGNHGRYEQLLRRYQVSSGTYLGDAQVYPFAMEAKSIIDDYYFGRHGGCLYSTEKDYPWGPGVWHNLASLFHPISRSHFRSLDTTGHTHQYGIAEGLMINDATNNFDGAYTQGYRPMHALYVAPGNYYENPADFSPTRATTLFYGPDEAILDTFHRKILNISGIDTYTLFAKDYEKVKWIPDLELLSTPLRTLSNTEFVLLRDKRSYGIAYVATFIHFVSPSLNTLEKYKYPLPGKRSHLIPEYKRKVDELHGYLKLLSEPYSIYLEDGDKAPGVQRSGPGNSSETVGILGGKAAFNVSCKATPCYFVFNFANLHGWTAYRGATALPIKRVNFAFMGVELPQGEHLVWFEYDRLWVMLGRYLSLLAVIFSFSILMAHRAYDRALKHSAALD